MKKNILLSNVMNSDRVHVLLMNTQEICELRGSLFEVQITVHLQFHLLHYLTVSLLLIIFYE